MADRRESVTLILNDQMTGELARASATVKVLDRQMRSAGTGVESFGRQMDRTGANIDRYSGRLRILAESAAAVGPAFAPIGAAAVPALAGLATQLGFAAAAAGVVVGAFSGVGSALDALNKYQLEPTETNLENLRVAMGDLSPAGREMVGQLDEVGGELRRLRDIGADNLFPGVIAGLDAIEARAPDFQRIVEEIANTAGGIFAEFGEGLASDRADAFFEFIEREARPQLEAMAEAVANVATAAADMWMALDPLSDEFSRDLVAVTEDFAEWAENLAQSQGFQEFVNYAIEAGPKVADTFTAIVGALAAIVEAAAPLGGPVLSVLEAVARVVEAIASSDAGAPLLALVVAVSALRRSMALLGAVKSPFVALQADMKRASTAAQTLKADLALASGQFGPMGARAGVLAANLDKKAAAVQRLKDRIAGLKGSAGVLAGVGVAATGVADGMGLTNTASLALMGTIAGPWGAALGAGAGLLMDFAAAEDEAEAKAQAFAAALDQATGQITEFNLQQIRDELDATGLTGWAQENGIAVEDMVVALAEGGTALERLVAQVREINGTDAAPVGPQFSANAGTEADIIIGKLQGVAGVAAEAKEAFAANNRETEETARAFEQLDGSLGGITPRMSDVAGAADLVADAAENAAEATDDFQDAATDLTRALSGRASLRDFEAAIDEATRALKDNGKTLDVNIERGRENAETLDEIAESGVAMAQTLRGADRVGALERTRDAVARAAEGFGMGRREAEKFAGEVLELDGLIVTARAEFEARESTRKIERYKDDLLTLPPEVQTEITANGIPQTVRDVKRLQEQYDLTPEDVETLAKFLDGPARAQLAGYAAQLDRLDRRKDVTTRVVNTIMTVFQTVGNPFNIAQLAANAGHAEGGHVRGPGSATSDSIPAALSNGEYVVRAAAVNRYGVDLFHRLNAMQFANGGHVTRSAQPTAAAAVYSTGAAIDYDRLALVLARNVRPVNINGDPEVYRRYLRQEAAAESLGGGRI